EKDQLTGSFTITDGDNTTPMANPTFGTVLNLRNQIVSLQETHVFSPTVINTFTAGFSRASLHFATPPLDPNFSVDRLTFVPGRLPGRLRISGSVSNTSNTFEVAGSSSNSTYVPHRSLFSFTDGAQVVRGSHQISFGARVERLRSNEHGSSNQSGIVT